MNSKKGVSQVVTYVLLIVTALGLSVVVFAFLQGFVPEPQFECPAGLSIVIKEIECVGSNQVDITFQNKGRFEIDGIYSRYSSGSDAVSANELKPIEFLPGGALNDITTAQAANGFLYFGRNRIAPIPLKPTKEYTQRFSFSGSLAKVEIQPFLNLEEERELGICEDKVVTREYTCT